MHDDDNEQSMHAFSVTIFLATAQWDPLPQNDFVATVNEAIRDAVTALTTGMLIALQV